MDTYFLLRSWHALRWEVMQHLLVKWIIEHSIRSHSFDLLLLRSFRRFVKLFLLTIVVSIATVVMFEVSLGYFEAPSINMI